MIRFIPIFLTAILLLCSLAANAQGKDPKIKYGKISDEEMAMETYAPDPAAPAVILYDKGKVTNRYNDNTGFSLEFERHKRIKILKKEAYRFADIAIFYDKGQKVTEFKACCYNLENGKMVETKVNSDNVFEEKLAADFFVKKVAIPAVKEGSIIEFKYTIMDDGIGLPVSEWYFQDAYAPTLWSEFESSIPTFIQYKKLAQGWTPYSLAKEELKNERMNISFIDRGDNNVVVTHSSHNVNVDYSTNIMHYIQENVPALKPEPYVASVRDYLSKLSFDVRMVYRTSVVSNGPNYELVNASSKEYNRTWEGLGKNLLQNYFDDILNASKFTGSDAAKCIEGKTALVDKTQAIYAFIGKNYQSFDSDYLWKSQTMDKLTTDRKGTPTDLNLLFINMLRRAKVSAYPVLISTAPNGKALSFRVSVREFDRVIAAVALTDSTYTFIDASAWPSPIGLLPSEDMNGEGLLLKSEDAIDWIPLQSKMVDRSAVFCELSFKEDGALLGKTTFSETGHDALDGQQLIGNKDPQAFAREQFKDLIAGGKITDLKIENNPDGNLAVLKGSFEIETSSFSSVSGSKIYLTPTLSFGLKETPFKNPERKFGIDFGPPSNETYIFSFKIPAGYRLEEAPKSTKLSLGENALSFDYMVEKNNPELVKITVRKSVKTPFIPIDQYSDLQQFYSSMVAKMAEQIVLTK